MCLFDTNNLSDVIKNPQGAAPAKIYEVDEANIATSVVVAADLRFGAERRGSPRLTAQFDVRVALPILSFVGDVGIHHGQIRADLDRVGTLITIC